MSLKNKFSGTPAEATLQGYLAKGHLPHALLFSGPPESGQLEMAADLAQVLFCQKNKGGAACGACADCRQVLANTHPDFVTIAPEEGHALKVEAIRELISKSSLKPFQAPAKIFVINHADSMNDIAQNALLKTLEEPMGRTYFILISYAAEKLLPTIRSRTQVIYFSPVKSDVAPDPEIQGARHDILLFLFQEGDWKMQETVSLEREGVLQVLSLLIQDLRDLLILKEGAEEILGFIEDRPLKERVLNHFTPEELVGKIELLSEFREKFLASSNLKLTLSVLRDELAQATTKKV